MPVATENSRDELAWGAQTHTGNRQPAEMAAEGAGAERRTADAAAPRATDERSVATRRASRGPARKTHRQTDHPRERPCSRDPSATVSGGTERNGNGEWRDEAEVFPSTGGL